MTVLSLVLQFFPALASAQTYVPRVIIRFNDGPDFDPQIPNAADKFLDALKVDLKWQQLVAQFPGIRIKKLFTRVSQNDLLNLRNQAIQRRPSYNQFAPNFLTYFVIPCPPTVNPNAVVAALSAPPWNVIVKRAYVEAKPSKEFPSYSLNPTTWSRGDTGFLRAAATGGIDAEWAWGIGGGDGASSGLQLADVESAWDIGHSDLPPLFNPISGVICNFHDSKGVWSIDHGTAVLGIVAAKNNSQFNLGVTPKLSGIKLVSYWDDSSACTANDPNRPDAISQAIAAVNAGDVVLIETQVDDPNVNALPALKNLPVEYEEHIFELIREGSIAGKIIVEAAGNGGHDLDNLPYGIYVPWLVRSSGPNDSGAILVTGATWYAPHQPLSTSQNRGTRIDCYAWGENIYTITSTQNRLTAGNKDGSMSFGGTSGAAAIVAGAALAVQSMNIAHYSGNRMDANNMRNTLCSGNNTPSSSPISDKIGVMPNLNAIGTSKGFNIPNNSAGSGDTTPPAVPTGLRVN